MVADMSDATKNDILSCLADGHHRAKDIAPLIGRSRQYVTNRLAKMTGKEVVRVRYGVYELTPAVTPQAQPEARSIMDWVRRAPLVIAGWMK